MKCIKDKNHPIVKKKKEKADPVEKVKPEEKAVEALPESSEKITDVKADPHPI